jgi:uncharacterized heparinase superfamily protein
MKDEKENGLGFVPHPSSLILKLKRMLRGEVSARTAALETRRRIEVSLARRSERADLSQLDRQPARLSDQFSRLSAAELLAHFRSRQRPEFFPGFAGGGRQSAALQQKVFRDETAQLIIQATRIASAHSWSLLGLGEKCFGAGEIDWNLDPLSGFDWPLSYHADINLYRNDGSDVRVVWELNRLAHFITLGRAYAITDDSNFSAEFFRQVASWREQNPVGLGVNWNCAMEVALRAMNLLAAFELFLRAPQMNETELGEFLKMLDQHGAHIRRNLEFSNIATSNHYLADVTGLLWLGLMLPELEAGAEWREFGLGELLREMDKQVFPDGADYEASTGYHRLKLELFLYSFVLCHLNGIAIDEKYWNKLRGMIGYVGAYLRPDGRAPLIGDSDSGQVLPIVRRTGDDHAYVVALGAAVFQEPRFKIASSPPPEELLWILGEHGLRDYDSLPAGEPARSQAFPDAGTYIFRDDDLYLLFNASGSGVNGRGSHGHNDALSIEVSAGGSAFIVDPGSYVYTADLKARHRFRSVAYHSTVEVDGVEQNTTEEEAPFIIGNEAAPRVISWESGAETDVVIAEHRGYQRLPRPLTHRRTVRFEKRKRFWEVEDELLGEGEHDFSFRFHFAPGLKIEVSPDGIIEVCDKMSGARLLIASEISVPAALEERFSSRDYGTKAPSVSVCWSLRSEAPLTARFALIPLLAGQQVAITHKLFAGPIANEESHA